MLMMIIIIMIMLVIIIIIIIIFIRRVITPLHSHAGSGFPQSLKRLW